ncbi:pyruvate dehydrogenase complex dihydrolipoamide acetyltransferase [Fulvivirga ligni]|uniref:pyruvate dehydrogenase complex dihydrolipoamide acetyltransferase n=1 Tax=Fulvivirga ligni TaxID=2904246 RepID=UPI001F46E830|nr:pyruvate dehydrogenase complex dihydrolipoamide acetyltransferase [Fulvivirga ligni]UII20450.1 pyruvate dehydrogenase complex dihydrolipoamide acetyltransferase [Fulvivirga ligni]
MAEVIRMPKMSDTMEEGVIASWLVKEGDTVKSGDILAEVETDKATMELESYEDGTLLHIGVKEKDAVPVDGVIAIIGEKGEDISDLLKDVESGGSSKSEPKEEKSEDSSSDDEGAEEIDASDVNAMVITMPKMSDTMTEGTIASWQVKVGDKVSSGDIMAEVETDKATMELESYEDGTLLYIGVEEGDSVEVDGVLAIVGEKGADYEKLLKAHQSKQKGGSSEKKEAKKEAPKEESKPVATEEKSSAPAASSNGRVIASPLAKKMAEDKGYDITKIKGSGDHGRIIKRDVENYTPAAAQAPTQAATSAEGSAISIPQVVGEESYDEISVSQMRKTIGKRLAESKFTAPHFYVTMEINMDAAIEARKSMNEYSPVKISFNDMVIKAVSAALRKHPKINSSWLGDKIRFNKHIHIGVAVAVEEGLLVPVIRFADNKSLSHISAEVKDLVGKAHSKKLQPSDWEGNTFTISNLGMFGVEEFTAIINPPDACILAVGGIKQTAVVKNGQLVPGNVMKVTLSSDHRVVDGAMGAAFLQTLKELLENPVRLLV